VRSPRPARVLVRPEVLSAIAGAAEASCAHETGGPLLGTVQRSWERERLLLIVAVLGTVPPGPAVRGKPSSVGLGKDRDGERAVSALRWWRAVTGLELIHLGDWHKHPSGLPEPSPGDEMTALRMSAGSPAPVWLTAIVAGGAPPRFHREAGSGRLKPVTVTVEGEAIPHLPALPWHIADSPRFVAECRLLNAAGITVKVGAASGPERPGVLVRLHRDGAAPITVVTGARYPHEPPVLRDERGRRIALRGGWSAERFLVDLVKEA
jgi:proteasome lid subunit RPN8/RPN11